MNQFELSLRPQPPVAAADHLVLMRILISRVARRHGLGVSLSPVPFFGLVGSGAAPATSRCPVRRRCSPGGSGPHGMTADRQAARPVCAGRRRPRRSCPDPSCPSYACSLPLAGAYACWEPEAAVRFLVGGPAIRHGANVEVKIIDPSASPYFASAVILALALDRSNARGAAAGDHHRPGAADRGAARRRRHPALLPDRQTDVLAAPE